MPSPLPIVLLRRVRGQVSQTIPQIVRNTHSPIKLKENKVIEAKLFTNINTAAESGASYIFVYMT